MIGIHQSQFLPWVPYFYKILRSDKFTILDDVQFEKNGLHNRNTIKASGGPLWFTMPVRARLGLPINRIKVADARIYHKLLKTLDLNYRHSTFFDEVYGSIEKIFKENIVNLHELNMRLLNIFLKMIGAEKQFAISSELRVTGKKDDLLIEIIKYFNEDEYLSGKGALVYMDLAKFKRAGIKVYTYDFEYAEYNQLWTKELGFLPSMSIADLLFNDLKDARGYIMRNGSIKRIA